MMHALPDASLANLIMPIAGGGLLLPNSCVVEVASARQLSSAMASTFILGMLRWRQREIPLVCFEGLRDGELPAEPAIRQVAVMAGLNDRERLPHYAILLSSVPHLLSVHAGDVKTLDHCEDQPAIFADVEVHGQRLLIPDIDVLEEKILTELSPAEQAE